MNSIVSVLSTSILTASLSVASVALADTQGPGATLYKLDDRWVSVLPTTTIVAEAPVVEAAPAPAPAPVPGFRPTSNYSGACHVTVSLSEKTYVLNSDSSTDMVGAQGEGRVCLETEKIAIDSGFSPSAR